MASKNILPCLNYRLVIPRAFSETKKFWNIHRVWTYFASLVTALLSRVAFRGFSQMAGWKEIALFATFGFGITWIGTFLINLIRVPAIIHSEQHKEISELRKQLKEKAETPKRSPREDHAYKTVTETFNRLTNKDDVFKVLRHILAQEIVTIDELTPTTPPGITASDYIGICHQCELCNLLKADRPRPGKVIYTIPPGMKKAVEEIIFSPEGT